MYRGVRIFISWWVGLVMLTGGSGQAQEAALQDLPGPAVPAELRTWLTQTATPRALPPGSYPAEELVGVLPPHAPGLLASEATNGTVPTLDVVAARTYDVLVSDSVHQLNPNGELDDTTHCGRELPFPGLAPDANRAGLKAVWNLLCRNRGGSFEYLGHTFRGSGPNPHRTLIINGWNGWGPQGFGLRALTLAPGDQKDNEMMGWLPWARDKAESFYVYNMKMRRPRQGSTTRGDKMAGTQFTREHAFGWEGQFFFYDWEMLGERPVLTAFDSRHEFPQYLPVNRWFADDQWMLRPAFLVVGKRAHKGAGSGYVALWLDTVTFEPLWTVFYTEAGVARNILGLTFKWDTQYQRHVTLGMSAVDLDANGVPVTGTVFEAHFCSILHHPDAPADPASYNGQLLGKKPFNWSFRPPGCEDSVEYESTQQDG